MKVSYLKENLEFEIDRLGTSEYGLALDAGLKKDVIRDVLRGRVRQPAADKLLAIAKVLGRDVNDLLHVRLATQAPGRLSSDLAEERPPDVEGGVAIGEHGPSRGERIYDPDELALLRFFRPLSPTKRATVFGRLGIDELPSISEPKPKRA